MEKVKVCNFKVENCEILVDDLTDVQRLYIQTIEYYKHKTKTIPSIRKIAEIMGGYSAASVQKMNERLKQKGYDYRTLNYDDEVNYDRR